MTRTISARRATMGMLRAGARQGGRLLGDEARRSLAASLLDYPLWRLPGHYYSPLPDVASATAAARRAAADELPPAAIELCELEQLALLDALSAVGAAIEFPQDATPGWRFFHENSQYPYGDAILLHLLLRHWQPRRIIEVGSGFSTAMMIDTVERCADEPIAITCIEPYPDRLRSLVGVLPPYVTLVESPVQDVPLAVFDELEAGDVLFIDSTHVVKTGSDVGHELFRVLPRLAAGVRVHLHDICWPFEYPERWVAEGRAWNEAYLVHAYLAYNHRFEVTLFNDMMVTLHREWFERHLPRCLIRRRGEPDDVTAHGLWLTARPPTR